MIEQWKDIKGYEGLYQISNTDKVKALKRTTYMLINNCYRTYKEKVLKHNIANGYLTVLLYKNKIASRKSIHVLKAIAFIPNPDKLPEVNHIDNDPLNNDLKNLEWCTHVHNINHKVIQGRQAKGETHGMVKLNEKKIKKIRSLKGFTQRELAKKFNVYESTIQKIINKRTWKHI